MKRVKGNLSRYCPKHSLIMGELLVKLAILITCLLGNSQKIHMSLKRNVKLLPTLAHSNDLRRIPNAYEHINKLRFLRIHRTVHVTPGYV
uniref:Uncharacterized protein n=1 Tax=Glossina palpalis gambiensis TaxID=67801 RepID=A0A1B0ASR3_9MUSC